MKYTVVMIAPDGTMSVAGPFPDEYRATLFGNEIETGESGLTGHVLPLEDPASVRREIAR